MKNMIVGPLILVCVSLLPHVSSQEKHHICDRTTTEAAGLSGIVKITGNCRLNLTGVSGRISLLGVRKCDAASELTINSVSYCHDEDSTDSYIDVDVTEDQVVITAGKVDLFNMEYYHGKDDR